MDRSPKAEDHAGRNVLLRRAESGVRVRFFTLIIRLDSLHRKYPADIHTFFKEAKRRWEMDGMLCSTISMTWDFDEALALLEGCGMQCAKPPVDFYLVEAGFGTSDPLDAPHCLTIHSGELSFHEDDGKMYCRLKGPHGK
jgi:hypothetical protein